MNAITYDMQKLGEAVSALACGIGTIQERLGKALEPLVVLKSGDGIINKAKSAELERICLGLTHENVQNLSEEHAQDKARAIVELQSAVWHDAVWALEEKIIP